MNKPLAKQVSKALDHLYDLAYLETSPLAAVASPKVGSKGKVLRKALMDAIEALHPPAGTPTEEVAWRPYRIMADHYITGMSREELQEELALSKSQYYREHAKALDALCSIISGRWQVAGPSSVSTARELSDAKALARKELNELARHESQEALDLGLVVRDAISLLMPAIEERGLSLELRASAETLWVRSRPSLLRQSLLIPLASVADALAKGILRVSACLDRDRVILDIETEGAFRSWPQSDDREMISTVVRAAGGSVSFLEQSAAPCVQVSFPTIRQQRTVLLVDNSSELAALFARYLEGTHWSLVHARSVVQAIERCRQQAPSVILLDVLMPGQDGWHLLTQLKRSPETASIPVVICSVLNQPHLALSLGAVGYLRKPVTQHRLREALGRWGQGSCHQEKELPA